MNKNTFLTIAKALLLALALGLIFWLGRRFRDYDWDEIQRSPKCTEPFGVALYDSIVGEALGQRVVQSYGLPKNVKYKESAFLVDVYDYVIDDSIFDSAKKGAVVALTIRNSYGIYEVDSVANKADSVAVEEQDSDKKSSLEFRDLDYNTVSDYKTATATEVQTYDRTVTFGNNRKTKLRSFLCRRYIISQDEHYKPVCIASDTFTMACVREYPSGGKVIITTLPLIYTNYGVMDPDARKLCEYMSSFFKGRKLYRLHDKENDVVPVEDDDGDFKYILSQPPLKWAFYIILGLLVVYMVFNSRRRMKAIPVHKIDEDTTLQFAKVLGTFYYHQDNHVLFLIKRYNKLKSVLQSRYGWDVDKIEASDLLNRLYVITGIKKERIAKLLIRFREYNQDSRVPMTKEDIIEYIEIIKEIEKNLD